MPLTWEDLVHVVTATLTVEEGDALLAFAVGKEQLWSALARDRVVGFLKALLDRGEGSSAGAFPAAAP